MINKIRKEERGITLIALIITIIVLLILAGVAISMLSGENGILRQAAKAKNETEKKSIAEQLQLSVLTAKTEGLGKVNYNILNEEFEKIGFDRGKEIDGKYENDVRKLPKIIEIEGQHYAVSEEGKVIPAEWYYKKDEAGRKTIVTNGVMELKIGDYINYNAAAKDADETTIKEEKKTSYAGSPTATGYYKASEQIITEGNGYGTQTFSNKAKTNGWRVLGVDEETGGILIISANSVKTIGNVNFYLRGIAGWQYGDTEMDNVCSVFGSGFGATKARSIDVDDVNKITGYNPNNTGVYDPEQRGDGTKYIEYIYYKYGMEATYSWTRTANQIKFSGTDVATKRYTNSNYGKYGFNWYDKLTNTWKNSMQDISVPVNIVTLKATRYSYYPYSLTTDSETTGTQNGISTTSKEYQTLFCNKDGVEESYWLASPFIYANSLNVDYAYYSVYLGRLSSKDLYYAYGEVCSAALSYGLRPVVSLKSDIKLQYDKTKAYYDIIG